MHVTGFAKAVDVVADQARLAADTDEDAALKAVVQGAAGEVRAPHERRPVVDDDDLRVQCRARRPLRRWPVQAERVE